MDARIGLIEGEVRVVAAHRHGHTVGLELGDGEGNRVRLHLPADLFAEMAEAARNAVQWEPAP